MSFSHIFHSHPGTAATVTMTSGRAGSSITLYSFGISDSSAITCGASDSSGVNFGVAVPVSLIIVIAILTIAGIALAMFCITKKRTKMYNELMNYDAEQPETL